MPTHPAPRPASDLFPESMNLSRKQRQVLDALHTYTDGARAIDIANQLGMHVNTARGHLDALLSKGAVRVTTAPAHGRGRPSLIFHARLPDNRDIAHEYLSLIEVLADTITDHGQRHDQARSIGSQWARAVTPNQDTPVSLADALDYLHRRLRDLGFDPTIHDPDAPDPDREITLADVCAATARGEDSLIGLNACPFVPEGSGRPPPFICALHNGFTQEILVANGLDATVTPFDAPGRCTIHLHPRR